MSSTRSDRDLFEVTEINRRGAHRPRSSPWASLLPVLVVGVLVLALAGIGYMFLGRSGDAANTSADPIDALGASPSVSPLPEAGSPAPSSEPSPSSAPEPSSSAAESGTVDKSLVVNFYNGSAPNIPGLSRKAAAALQAKGWKIGEIQPWTGAAVDGTTVYYGDESQLATAGAVIKQLGVGTARSSPKNAKSGLTVVISNDYTP